MIKVDTNLSINKSIENHISTFLESYKPHFKQSFENLEELSRLSDYGKKISSNYDELCIVGVGGSSLGSKALYEVLGSVGKSKKIIFFDNIDAYSFEQKFSLLNKSNCHWLFVSKSGGTQEVLALINSIIQKYEKFNFSSQCTIITDNKPSPLFNLGKENNVNMFFIPEEVGGRYSVLTPVGLLPLAFLGHDYKDAISGFEWAMSNKNLSSRLSTLLIDSFAREEWIHLLWIYSDSFQNFGLWLQQLWMESLGKKIDKSGKPAARVSSLFTARGISDQHSILQQVAEGANDKFVCFLSDSRAHGYGEKLVKTLFEEQINLVGFGLGKLCSIECQATYESLSENGLSVKSIYLEEVSTRSVVALMSLYMMSTVAIADYLNIDPFDQPGVESSKLITKKILSGLTS